MTGSHEMFVGMIYYVHADSDIVDQKGNIDYSMVELL
jgi:hypothetical protein